MTTPQTDNITNSHLKCRRLINSFGAGTVFPYNKSKESIQRRFTLFGHGKPSLSYRLNFACHRPPLERISIWTLLGYEVFRSTDLVAYKV